MPIELYRNLTFNFIFSYRNYILNQQSLIIINLRQKTQMPLLKLIHNQQIHLYKGEFVLSAIKKHCSTVFKAVPSNFQFTYIDHDGDQITINTQADLEILNEFNEGKIIKMSIHELDSEFQVIGSESSEAEETQSCEELLVEGKNICSLGYRQLYEAKMEQEKIEQEEKIKEVVEKFLHETEVNIIQKMMKEEEDMIKEEVDVFMLDLNEECCNKVIKEEEGTSNKLRRIRKPSIKPIQVNPELDDLIDAKINKILPGLITKITKHIQKNMKSQCCCSHNSQSQLQFHKTLNKQLLKKLQNKQCHF